MGALIDRTSSTESSDDDEVGRFISYENEKSNRIKEGKMNNWFKNIVSGTTLVLELLEGKLFSLLAMPKSSFDALRFSSWSKELVNDRLAL